MGVEKQVIRPGTGPKPVAGQNVTVHCTGFGQPFFLFSLSSSKPQHFSYSYCFGKSFNINHSIWVIQWEGTIKGNRLLLIYMLQDWNWDLIQLENQSSEACLDASCLKVCVWMREVLGIIVDEAVDLTEVILFLCSGLY